MNGFSYLYAYCLVMWLLILVGIVAIAIERL